MMARAKKDSHKGLLPKLRQIKAVMLEIYR